MLRTQIDSPTYAANYFDPNGPQDQYFAMPKVSYLKLAAVHGERSLTLFALNRSLSEEMDLAVRADGYARLEVADAVQLADKDLKAANTRDQPERILPGRLAEVRVEAGSVKARLKPASWNVIRLNAG